MLSFCSSGCSDPLCDFILSAVCQVLHITYARKLFNNIILTPADNKNSLSNFMNILPKVNEKTTVKIRGCHINNCKKQVHCSTDIFGTKH